METLLREIAEDSQAFCEYELNFLQGILQSYVESGRRALKEKRKVLGHNVVDLERRVKVGDALLTKIADMAASLREDPL